MVKGSSKKHFDALVLQTLPSIYTAMPAELSQRAMIPADLNLPVLMLKHIMEVAFPLSSITKITSVEELQKKYKPSLHSPPAITWSKELIH